MHLNTPMLLYIVVSLVAIGLLIFFLVRCKRKDKDNYCLCDPIRRRVCQGNMKKAYRDGLTEYSRFKNRGWVTDTPGDLNWPKYEQMDQCIPPHV